MKKKTLLRIGSVIALLICVVTYLRPLSFTEAVSDNCDIDMILQSFEVIDGRAHNGSVEYQDITLEQNKEISALLEKYSYRRTLGTLFSDGTISDAGGRLLSIFINSEGLSFNKVIVLTSSGDISIDDKCYSMKNAGELIEQLIEIVE